MRQAPDDLNIYLDGRLSPATKWRKVAEAERSVVVLVVINSDQPRSPTIYGIT